MNCVFIPYFIVILSLHCITICTQTSINKNHAKLGPFFKLFKNLKSNYYLKFFSELRTFSPEPYSYCPPLFLWSLLSCRWSSSSAWGANVYRRWRSRPRRAARTRRTRRTLNTWTSCRLVTRKLWSAISKGLRLSTKFFRRVNPTKLFFFGNEENFLFSLLSLAVVQYTNFFHMLQTLKLNTKNRKTGKIKVW